MRYLTFALTKGRLASKTLDMLEKLGITCDEMKDKNSRKLIFTKRSGCTDLCRIWCCRYRRSREGHHH